MSVKGYDCGNCFRVSVHLDEAKVLEDGTPDPEWVVEYEWGKTPPEGQTLPDYLATIKREALALAELELSRRLPPVEVDLGF